MHELAAGSVLLADSLLQSPPQPFQRLMSAIDGMGVSEWVAVGSMLGAWVAAWQAFRSTRMARRMYSLSVEAERLKEPALKVYLADYRILNPPSEDRRIYVFHLLITNTSLSANSIKGIELSLEYGQQGQPPSNVVVPHDASAAMAASMEATEVIRVPCCIAAGAPIAGAALFPIDTGLIGDGVVESHVVTVTDAYDQDSSVPSHSAVGGAVMSGSKWRSIEIPLSHPAEADPVPIVGDGIVATAAQTYGRNIPILILDTSTRPDIETLVRAHGELGPGDAISGWSFKTRLGLGLAAPMLVLKFTKPSQCLVMIEFDLEEAGHSGGSSPLGDRVSTCNPDDRATVSHRRSTT